jgi:hypothetical protein
MKKKHAKKAAKKILKIADKKPGYYTQAEVQYAKLLLTAFKKAEGD